MSKPSLKANIMIVDDTPVNLNLLNKMLTRRGYGVFAFGSGRKALAEVEHVKPELVLLDVSMPEMDGYQVCEQLKGNPATASIPVIFLSALSEPLDKVRAFRAGGVDYVTKPFEIIEVIARVETHLANFRQQKEIERLRQQEKAYYRKLVQMRDDVVRSASHDLRNPVTSVKLATSLLRQVLTAPDPKVERYLTIIEHDSQRILGVITNLLDLAQIETGIAIHPSEVTLPTFIEACVETFLLQAELEGITLRMGEDLPDVILQIDENQMGRAVQNLLSNALKYTLAGGEIVIDSTLTRDLLEIRVADTGIGISEGDHPHLFKKFYRVEETSGSVQGTGLGLAIVKAIVEQHGGYVGVESAPEQGSTFTIQLPVTCIVHRQPSVSDPPRPAKSMGD